MDLPPLMVEAVRSGRAVLVLGSGASLGSKTKEGKKAPTSTELGHLLAEKFLSGKFRTTPLANIGQLAIDTVGQREVEYYLRDIFEPLEPTPAHKQIATFVWHFIATTNYDRLVEKAYDEAGRAQRLNTVITNLDRIQPSMLGPESVILYKLHGCVSRVPDPACPLVLSHDQYITHLKGRDKLFDNLKAAAYDFPFIFVGQSVTDPDLRAIVLETSEPPSTREQFFVVAPDIEEIQMRSWAQKRVTAVNGTLASLLAGLDKSIPRKLRNPLQTFLSLDHPISKKFEISGAQCSSRLLTFLEQDADYLGALPAIPVLSPREFFKGHSPRWAAVTQLLDVKRELQDSILEDVFLPAESERRNRPELFVLKGPSGSGKSVLMQRVALAADKDFDCIVIYMKDDGNLDHEAICELVNNTRKRVFLLLDNAGDRVGHIRALLERVAARTKLLTMIVSERTNEWNTTAASIENWVVREFEIGRLSNTEITGLVDMLDRFDCLGSMTGCDRSEIVELFKSHAYRHLLVALYEVTYGKPLEEIVQDEYASLSPEESKSLYLTVCVLNRFNVPVRAGVVSRIHDLPFEEFKKRFFKPLEHVVYTYEDASTKDHYYKARHPVIADIVFHNVLRNEEERFERYNRCLKGLNPLYSVDRVAVREMLQARDLMESFKNHDLVSAIYRYAGQVFSDDAYVLQQEAIYEMKRPNGNLQRAYELLRSGSSISPDDSSIKHSQAELQLHFGDNARTAIEQQRHWKEAERIATGLLRDRTSDFPFHTIAKVGLRRLERLVEDGEGSSDDFEQIVNKIEENLTVGLQRFPGNPYLKEAEARLGKILQDDDRVKAALEAAFTRNPRNVFVAKRLAEILEREGSVEESRTVLQRALEAHPSSPHLHFAYSRYLETHDGNVNEILHHLKRSFSEGDENISAQILFGKHLLLGGQQEAAEKLFGSIGERKGVGYGRQLRLWPLQEHARGYLKRKEDFFAMVTWDKWRRWVFARCADSDPDNWDRIRVGQLVTFSIAFNAQGPVATDLREC